MFNELASGFEESRIYSLFKNKKAIFNKQRTKMLNQYISIFFQNNTKNRRNIHFNFEMGDIYVLPTYYNQVFEINKK